MDTNDLKILIGSDCLVIDPRSKKKKLEPAKINSASFSLSTVRITGEIYERISFGVVLKKLTVSKRRGGTTLLYNRTFTVSGDKIQIPS